MLRLIKLELKHILKMRSTIVIFFILIILAIGISILSTYGENGYVLNNNESTMLSGLDAVHNIQQVEKETEVSEEHLADVFEKQKEIYKNYGESIPDEVFVKDVYPYSGEKSLIQWVYGAEFNYNYSKIYDKLSRNDILKFYDKLKNSRSEYLGQQLKGNTKAYELEQKRAEKINIPFYYYPKVGWDSALDKLGASMRIIAFLCCTLAVQLFSGNYQNGADVVFRTTKHGRKKLAISRIIAMSIVGGLLYIIYIGVYTLSCIKLFGTNGLRDPIQLISIFSCSPYTIGQIFMQTISLGMISVISVIIITLCVSAKVKSPIYALTFSIAIMVVPIIIQSMPGAPNLVYFISDIFPSSGMDIYGELVRSNYYFAIRSPYVITTAAILNIILGAFLTRHFYEKHEGGR